MCLSQGWRQQGKMRRMKIRKKQEGGSSMVENQVREEKREA